MDSGLDGRLRGVDDGGVTRDSDTSFVRCFEFN